MYNAYYYPQNQGITWVQGEAGAKSYMTAPNTTVQLWDSEAQVIYLKSADVCGMPSMKVLDYTIRDNAPKSPAGVVCASDSNCINYATKDDVKALNDEIKRIRERMDNMKEASREPAV